MRAAVGGLVPLLNLAVGRAAAVDKARQVAGLARINDLRQQARAWAQLAAQDSSSAAGQGRAGQGAHQPLGQLHEVLVRVVAVREPPAGSGSRNHSAPIPLAVPLPFPGFSPGTAYPAAAAPLALALCDDFPAVFHDKGALHGHTMQSQLRTAPGHAPPATQGQVSSVP